MTGLVKSPEPYKGGFTAETVKQWFEFAEKEDDLKPFKLYEYQKEIWDSIKKLDRAKMTLHSGMMR